MLQMLLPTIVYVFAIFFLGIYVSSAIYIAAPVFYWWHKGDRKHVEAHADVLAGASGALLE